MVHYGQSHLCLIPCVNDLAVSVRPSVCCVSVLSINSYHLLISVYAHSSPWVELKLTRLYTAAPVALALFSLLLPTTTKLLSVALSIIVFLRVCQLIFYFVFWNRETVDIHHSDIHHTPITYSTLSIESLLEAAGTTHMIPHA